MKRPRGYAPIDLSGAVVVVTGAGRGIGLRTAQSFAGLGATVVVADLDAEAARSAVETLAGRGVPRRVDVTDAAAMRALIDDAETAVGPIEVLVNNAGIMPIDRFVDESNDVSERTVAVNLLGTVHGMRAVLPHMYCRGRGHVVNIASMAGKVPAPGLAVYNASKYAVVGLSASVRTEAAASGVSVSAVLPAAVRTSLIDGVPKVPGLPTVDPTDVAAAVVASCHHRRGEIHVPRWLGAWDMISALVPNRVLASVRRRMGEDEILDQIDREARDAYQRRIDSQLET